MNDSENNEHLTEPAQRIPFVPPWKWVGIFCILCVLAVFASRISTVPNILPEAGVEMDLPERVMGMIGKEQPVSEGEIALLPKDTEFAKKVYNDFDGNAIYCQIVLSGGDRRSIHRPEACLPGQGWNMLSNEPARIELSNGRELTVQKLRLSRQVEVAPGVRKTLPMLFLYWYVGSEVTTHDQIQRILLSNFDLLLKNRVHRWAYVIVSSPVLQGLTNTGLDESGTFERLSEFIREAVPQFQKSEMVGKNVETPGVSLQ